LEAHDEQRYVKFDRTGKEKEKKKKKNIVRITARHKSTILIARLVLARIPIFAVA
jgi:hypothetical protein